MARFFATHTAPMTEEALKGLTTVQLPEDISWNVSYCDFPENVFFCEWNAPSKERLEDLFRSLGIQFDNVYPVQIFNVAKAELED